jgi:chromosome segregation ATPase
MGTIRLVNPFDVLSAPPALLKRALDDLHEIAQLVRRYMTVEDDILARVEQLESELAAMRAAVQPLSAQLGRVEKEIVGTRQAAEALPARIDATLGDELRGVRAAVEPLPAKLDDLAEEMTPIAHLEPIRRGIEPLEQSMVTVRESVDDLEPMLAEVHEKIAQIDPKLEDMRDSVEPLGDLAERIPGNRRRRRQPSS